MKRAWMVSVLTLVAIYLCGAVCSHAAPPHGIILISLDTLRADHLGCYGYHNATSPHIDEFSKESVVFENTVVQSCHTLPSHLSIMTSLYPHFHKSKDCALAEEHVTLAELLKEAGYQTAAFTDGGWMQPTFGFNQGFDIYKGKRQIGIARILPKVKRWLKKNQANPFFLFIHCYDIHAPYDPPPPYSSMFHEFNYTGSLFPTIQTLGEASKKEIEVNEDDIRHFISLYDGGIRYTDEKIGEFLSHLQNIGLKDQALIIITSDHGEEFREHGAFGHRQLHYRPILNVPLLIRIPGFPRKKIRIQELVRSIDLLPTIVDLVGLPPHPEAQGRSLVPLIRRHKNFMRRSLWKLVNPFTNGSSIPSLAEFANYHYSVIRDNHQIIYNSVTKACELFNLKDDPYTQNNIAETHGEISKLLLLQFQDTYGEIPKFETSRHDLDEKTREQLKALGYLDGTNGMSP